MQPRIIQPQREITDPEKARQYVREEDWAPVPYRENLASDLTDEEAMTTAQTILENALIRAWAEKQMALWEN